MIDLNNKILSDITVHMKYAKYIPELNRRETWEELVTRNKSMHLKKYPKLSKEINEAYSYVYDKKVLFTVEGKNGSYIDTFSKNSGEYEVLFMPNTRFKIIKSEIRYKLNLSDSEKIINLEEFGELYKSLDNSQKRSLEYNMAITIREVK